MTTLTLDFVGENRVLSSLHAQVQELVKENTISSLKVADDTYRFYVDCMGQFGRVTAEGKEGILKQWGKDYKRMLKTAKPEDEDLLAVLG